MADKKNESQTQQETKVITESVIAAITAAANGLKGDELSFEDALAKAGKEDPFFNPTLSQYRKGMVLNTDPALCKIKKVSVGTSGREAWVIVCPVGHMEEDKPVYDAAFNLYPSTLRKNILVTDEMGDPVLDEHKQQKEVNAGNQSPAGNAVYEAAKACAGPKQLLEYAMNKLFLVDEIYRDFGPAGFVEKNGLNKATTHKLTSAPAFRIIG